ncbi:MAG: SAM-dependent methyltransferase [Rhodobacterales bacterium]|nr:MAG: SAM-dependent methyltransferase [Rhodobacterales bacterium]
MWNRLLKRLLARVIKQGRLSVTFFDGSVQLYGDGSGDPISVCLHSADLARKLVLHPQLALGEAYMDGDLTVEDDDLHGMLSLMMANIMQFNMGYWHRKADSLRHQINRLTLKTHLRAARRNVQHHYDLSDDLYDLFLDPDKQYSCAYFRTPDMTLEQAQDAKKQHIAKKLLLKPGMKVLDIGCGWGGMGLMLARDYGVEVVGVTLSERQHEIATKRAAEAGLADKCSFLLRDYRNVEQRFDRIVSVGMLEHVGHSQYDCYFQKIRQLLKPDGVALIHTIGRSTPPEEAVSPWISKYIFPGGYAPALSELMQSLEKSELFATDIEVWRMHYARTLQIWRDRFEANIDAARQLYDDRFCRMWRFYLISSELSFSIFGLVVFQMQISRDQMAVPLTRDYICS